MNNQRKTKFLGLCKDFFFKKHKFLFFVVNFVKPKWENVALVYNWFSTECLQYDGKKPKIERFNVYFSLTLAAIISSIKIKLIIYQLRSLLQANDMWYMLKKRSISCYYLATSKLCSKLCFGSMKCCGWVKIKTGAQQIIIAKAVKIF